jgi:hypothetical protein
MANEGHATAVSDLERAEHLGYSDSKGVKRVSIFNDGVQVSAATEETLQASLSDYKITDIDDAGYYGYMKADGSWYIMSGISGAYRYIKGNEDYTTAWSGRVGLDYEYFNLTFN